MNFSYHELRKYLLGALPPDEFERIDRDLIEDRSLEVDLLRAEDALINDYIDKNLTEEEEELFFQNFLISRPRFDAVRKSRVLRTLADEHVADIPKKKSRVENVSAAFMYLLALDRRPSLSILGILVIIFAATLVWQIGRNRPSLDNNGLQAFLSEVTKRDLSDLNNFKDYSSVNLFAEDGQNHRNRINVRASGLSKDILLRLALPPEAVSENCFSLEIAVNEGQKFSVSKIKAYPHDAGSEIRILVPREIAEKKDCQITLTGRQLKSPQLKYYLRLD
ncbi:MAG: hypothetical protein KIS76_02395 [Pyrinomonadaceae bacterium]|nr:hypothetical protein [Pyrinomonadaceae bacterium]